jgi:hypothetical protein
MSIARASRNADPGTVLDAELAACCRFQRGHPLPVENIVDDLPPSHVVRKPTPRSDRNEPWPDRAKAMFLSWLTTVRTCVAKTAVESVLSSSKVRFAHKDDSLSGRFGGLCQVLGPPGRGGTLWVAVAYGLVDAHQAVSPFRRRLSVCSRDLLTPGGSEPWD